MACFSAALLNMDISSLNADILRQPHCLIAGATGSGKSVCLNSILCDALAYGDKYFIMIDPKGCELGIYKGCKNTLFYAAPRYRRPDKYYNDLIAGINKANNMMVWRLDDMQRRGLKTTDYSDVYLCIDELADLMISPRRKEILTVLQRILQLGRAARVHVIACTQAPSRRIIPAELTLNFTARIGLRCETAIESRQIIGMAGCEALPLYGFAYYKRPGQITDLHAIMARSESDIKNMIQYCNN